MWLGWVLGLYGHKSTLGNEINMYLVFSTAEHKSLHTRLTIGIFQFTDDLTCSCK
jgi:hypothetical protein